MAIRPLLPLIAALFLMTISASEATFSNWESRHSWFKWRCYVPGCSSCEAYNPYKCTACSTGYTLLADNTCGCAAGYGSWANPPVATFPYNKPLCPRILSSRSGKTISMATTSSVGRTTWIPATKYYIDKPTICWHKYYADNKCQPSPKPGYGYCSCTACPVGYTSKGNTSIAESVCTPINGTGGGGGPILGRCAGQPPAVENANPWRPGCNNKKQGLSCYTGCKAGFRPSPRVIATCNTGGNWTVSGQCIRNGPTAPACPGVPELGADANAWAANCRNGAVGDTCTASCAEGFEGNATATCRAGGAGWSVESSCIASPPGPLCPGTPETFDDNALPFDEATCVDGELNSACETACAEGFIGGYSALCTEDGWDVQGECIEEDGGGGGGGEVDCPGEPEAIDDGSALPWSEGEGVCSDGAIDDVCTTFCEDGYDGFADAYCTEFGWEVYNDCVPLERRKKKNN